MSSSFAVFDAVVAHLVQRLAPRRALDGGVGQGKHGRLLAMHAPSGVREPVDQSSCHAAQFALSDRYRRLHLTDVCSRWPQQALQAYELVILGDCLGQMPKSLGMDLLHALFCPCAWGVLVAPEFMPWAGDVSGSEAPFQQRAVWTERDLHRRDLWAWDNCRATTPAVLRGQGCSNLSLHACEVRGPC